MNWEEIKGPPDNFPVKIICQEWGSNASLCFSASRVYRYWAVGCVPTERIQPSTDRPLSLSAFTQLLNNRKTKASGVPQSTNEKCSPYEESCQTAWDHWDAAKRYAWDELSRNLNEYSCNPSWLSLCICTMCEILFKILKVFCNYTDGKVNEVKPWSLLCCSSKIRETHMTRLCSCCRDAEPHVRGLILYCPESYSLTKK